MINLLTYPARPVNGGPFDKAPPKIGQWVYQPKYNGWRALVHVPTGAMFNRHGQLLSITSEFSAALAQLRGTLDALAFRWADCEALDRRHGIGRGTLIVLDVVPESDYAPTSWSERRRWLSPVPPLPWTVKPADHALYLSDLFDCPDQLRQIWKQLPHLNEGWGAEYYEGLVAKRAHSLYPIQLNSPDQPFLGWMKHRFL